MDRNRYILKGANHLVAEAYADDQGWHPTEWIYIGPSSTELLVIDLEDKDASW